MAKKLLQKYYVKSSQANSYSDVTTLFNGVNILSVAGLDDIGKAVNVYNEQWITSDQEDFLVTTNNGVIVRENTNIKVTFIVGRRYANSAIDVQTVYDSFISFMTSKDLWIASTYIGKETHCVALDGFEPKTIKYHRGVDTYILGEITLHQLSKPSAWTLSPVS